MMMTMNMMIYIATYSLHRENDTSNSEALYIGNDKTDRVFFLSFERDQCHTQFNMKKIVPSSFTINTKSSISKPGVRLSLTSKATSTLHLLGL